MKIAMDPMPLVRQRAIDRVTSAFLNQTDYRELAHAQKRVWAETKDQRLKPEADLRGITVDKLAQLILSKPDALAARELQRQQSLLRIDAAQTIEELNSI